MLLEFVRMLSTFKPDEFQFQVLVDGGVLDVKRVYEVHQAQMVVLASLKTKASSKDDPPPPDLLMGINLTNATIILPERWQKLYFEVTEAMNETIRQKYRMIVTKVPKKATLHLDSKELYEIFYDTLENNRELSMKLMT